MIKRLRRRLTLLVICVLALVTAGIVLSIHAIDLRNIDSSAHAALRELGENNGRRPQMVRDLEGTPPPLPDGQSPDATPPPKPDGDRSPRDDGRRGIDMPGGNALASLSNTYTITMDATGQSVKLGAKEYQLMEVFLRNPGQILPKETLIERVWGYDSDAEYNNLEVDVSFLRTKLSFIGAKVKLKATRGLGYSLEESDD